jgi:hypothetical protein
MEGWVTGQHEFMHEGRDKMVKILIELPAPAVDVNLRCQQVGPATTTPCTVSIAVGTPATGTGDTPSAN